MTHQPPVPEGNTSPYPLHPEPVPEEVKQRHAAEEAAAREEKEAQEQAEVRERRVRTAALGVGAALAAGAAAVTGLLYGRRRSAKSAEVPAKPAPRARTEAARTRTTSASRASSGKATPAKAAPSAKASTSAKASSAKPASPKPASSTKAVASAPRTRSGGDDKSKRGAQDRSRVAANEPYEVNYFARKHGITAGQAREIIQQAGPDRKAANALAERRKAE